ncbi:21683_t:CDS:1, partial [Gigaspora margarita]
ISTSISNTCANSIKRYITNAYNAGIKQLKELLDKTTITVHLTTDL